jgi:RND superfamily putative drug exporter
MNSGAERSPRRRRLGSPFDWLGRGIVRHPWYSILLWVVILVISLPAIASVGSVISTSFGSAIPSSYPSVAAQNELAREFPNASGSGTSALILLEMTNITGPTGRNATLAVTQALRDDPKLQYVSSITSMYSAYGAYLAGEAELGEQFLQGALTVNPSLPVEVNETASEVWGPAQAFVANWERVAGNLSGNASASSANWPAFRATLAELSSRPPAQRLLSAFYYGNNGSIPGFNVSATPACLDSRNLTPCADAAMWETAPMVLPELVGGPANVSAAEIVLASLSLQNLSCWSCVQSAGSTLLGSEVGISPAWLLTVWQSFPGAHGASSSAILSWAEAAAANPGYRGFLLPMPSAVRSSFISASGNAALLIVSYSVDDNYAANGSTPTYSDDAEVSHVLSQVLGGSTAFASITYYVTGESPLDSATTYLATSALSVLLILTVVVLVSIMIIYFRAPAAPLVSFGAIGIAIAVSLGAMFVVGKLVTSFNSEVEPVLLVFLMSIGTDYSVFLMARYREELVKGASSEEAVRTTVRWAGQSITTSGLTVVVVTVAMAFAGIGPISQFGLALSFGVLIALLVALTVVPAILRLAGPRIFWPNTGERFRIYARRRNEAVASSTGYIARAGRIATRRPWAVIGVILLLSAPVIVVALEVPVSYNISNIGLPSSEPAQKGFVALNDQFGPGYTSPSYVLVTFATPVMAGGAPNATEFGDIAGLTSIMAGTPGVGSVGALAGGSGLPLSFWQNYTHLLAGEQAMAQGELGSYVGADGRTVEFQVTTNASGFSAPAVSVLDDLRGRVSSYDASHPEVTQVRYGGAAQTTEDLRNLVSQTNEGMLLGAAVGLFVILLIILGSAFVPALALGAIGLSILWGWAGTYFIVGILENEALVFLLPLILLIMILGLGMDYNVLLLTRVKEERSQGGDPAAAIQRAVTHAGGVITAAAVILGGAFLLLGLTSPLGMLAGIGLGIGIAVLLQAFVVQTYLTPAVLALGKDWIWRGRASSPPHKPS